MTKRPTGRHVRERARRASRRLPLLLALLCLPVSGLFVARNGDATAATTTLTNGCAVSARGIPSCGGYTGGAYGANSDPATWESITGRTLGVHRTYYTSSQVASAVTMAKADVAKKRIPWISFKLPYTWKEMAAGKGDAWAKDLATRMKAVGGPVWLAFHHEPESESQSITDWKAMQVRLSPIIRSTAPNVAFTVILMGYWEFYGTKSQYLIDAIWPKTTVDMVGFDVYEKYGQVKNGVTTTSWTNFKDGYFAKMQAWSAKTGVPWGLAETGYSDPAAKAKPKWIQDTYAAMLSRGGKAFAYFNTDLHNKTANWQLSSTAKNADFTAAHKTSAHL